MVVRISSTIFVSEHGLAAALVPLARPSCTARRPPAAAAAAAWGTPCGQPRVRKDHCESDREPGVGRVLDSRDP